MERDEITPEILHELLEITDGWRLRWKPRGREWFKREQDWKSWNKRFSGTISGANGRNGYRPVYVLGWSTSIHVIIYAMHNGKMPDGEIDHIDNNQSNNNPSNLRECTHSQNMRNVGSRKNSTSVYLGVSLAKDRNKWHSRICADGNKMQLGYFTDEIEAAKAYDAAARKHHGAFANCNFPEGE